MMLNLLVKITNKKFITIFMVMMLAFTLSACSFSPQLSLTEDEEQQIVEYSSKLLLEHRANKGVGLTDTYAERERLARVEAMKAINKQIKEKESSDNDTSSDDTSDNDSNGSADSGLKYPQEGEQNIATALGQNGFDVSYSGFEVCSSYPYDGSEGNYFAMDATAGKQLVVFHFDIANISSEDGKCDILSHDPMFRIIVNDDERINALTTLLSNDLATIDETIPAGGNTDAVVVLETDLGYEASFETVSLLMKYGNEQSVIPIVE